MNTISDLRSHLFDTLEQLKDKQNPMEIERAKAVGDIAQVIINSAKAEIDFMKASGSAIASPFIEQTSTKPAINNGQHPELSGGKTTVKPGPNGTTITTHKMR